MPLSSGRIQQWKIGEVGHTVKAICAIHKQCSRMRSAKRLPYGADNKIAEWLLLGQQRFPDRGDGGAHLGMFDAACLGILDVGVC